MEGNDIEINAKLKKIEEKNVDDDEKGEFTLYTLTFKNKETDESVTIKTPVNPKGYITGQSYTTNVSNLQTTLDGGD